MKKLLQGSILFVFIIVMVAAAFIAVGSGSSLAAAAPNQPQAVNQSGLHMGVNSNPTHSLAFAIIVPPIFRPDVGWNG
jgi:hypothetical protein